MPRRTIVLLAAVSIAATGFVTNLATAKAAGSGTFSVLTYNVSGLPEAVNSAPTPRGPSTTAIGERIGTYDLVNVQEDFNFHSKLYAADSHPNRTSTSGGAGIGSGLNTLSSYPYSDFDRSGWNSCNSSDCLTPKGFSFLRVNLDKDTNVDLYNLHTNAGDSSADMRARADNLSQLTDFIKTHSAGNAVVVMGDTNTRYTRTGDTISNFVADNGLTDAWVQLQRDGDAPAPGSSTLLCDENAITNSCEVVDKVLYRGNASITINAVKYNNEHAAFLDSDGAMLSDHDPITVRFNWTKS